MFGRFAFFCRIAKLFFLIVLFVVPVHWSGAQSETDSETVARKYYGPVKNGETLWSIASAVRPDIRVSIQQTMSALVRLNPQDFVGDNMHLLRNQAILRIPTTVEAELIDKRQAVVEMNRQYRSVLKRAQQAASNSVASARKKPVNTVLSPPAAGSSGDPSLASLVEAMRKPFGDVLGNEAAERAGSSAGGAISPFNSSAQDFISKNEKALWMLEEDISTVGEAVGEAVNEAMAETLSADKVGELQDGLTNLLVKFGEFKERAFNVFSKAGDVFSAAISGVETPPMFKNVSQSNLGVIFTQPLALIAVGLLLFSLIFIPYTILRSRRTQMQPSNYSPDSDDYIGTSSEAHFNRETSDHNDEARPSSMWSGNTIPETWAADSDTLDRSALHQQNYGDDPHSGGANHSEEMSMQLDLARAYIDMGHTQKAREALNAVVDRGSDMQRDEARELLQKL